MSKTGGVWNLQHCNIAEVLPPINTQHEECLQLNHILIELIIEQFIIPRKSRLLVVSLYEAQNM